jgi:hypothetical protein
VTQLDFFEKEAPEKSKETLFCRKCKEDKPLYSFNNCAVVWETEERAVGIRGVSGTARYCRECREDYQKSTAIARKSAPHKPHGLTRCECCSTLLDSKLLHLDHNHLTGQFRGWLCRACNTGLGALGDNIEGLERALHYLRKQDEQ